MKISSINLTRQYFALSNLADLSTIRTLLHPEATYSSANTGLYYGVTDIMTMMAAFFKSQQKLNWRIDSINALTEYITEVHFTCNSIELTGKAIERTGIERVVVVSGLIRHIEVR